VEALTPTHVLTPRDLHTSATFCRGFFWTDVSMWPGDAPPDMPLLLALHGRDELLAGALVLRSVTMEGHPRGQVGCSGPEGPPEGWLAASQGGCC
jgi:hypothetical protein